MLKLIRYQIAFAITAFTFLLLTIFTVILYSTLSKEQQIQKLQSTIYNLQSAANAIDSNLQKLQNLSAWSSSSLSVVSHFSAAHMNGMAALQTYDRILEEINSNAANEYIQRLVITDFEETLFQAGGVQINSERMLTPQIAQQALSAFNLEVPCVLYGTDPISATPREALLFIRPLTVYNQQVGVSLLISSPSVFTDSLGRYPVSQGDCLYLTANNTVLEVLGNSLTVSELPEVSGFIDYDIQVPENNVYSPTFQTASDGILVTCPLSACRDFSLNYFISSDNYHMLAPNAGKLFAVIAFCVLLGGIFILFYLYRIINRPVQKLKQHMTVLGHGNFERNPEIEWDNEFGQIGRGINSLALEVSELMEKRIADERLRKDLEYQMLQNQIHPHFIFNTLNTIKWIASMQHANGIVELTTAFSRLMKSVSKASGTLVPLHEELALLNDYFLIQQYRYGGSISLDISEISDERLCHCLIPRFTLQPIVENAIFHGIEPNGCVGDIRIRISEPSSLDYLIAVEDNGVGMTPKQIEHVLKHDCAKSEKFQHIGLFNVHRRIEFAFGKPYGLSIESVPGQFTRVCILLPRTNEGETPCTN